MVDITTVRGDILKLKLAHCLRFEPEAPFPEGFYMPLAWPKPSWSKWQVRDADVIAVKKISSKAAGYCYGNRVIYADARISSPLWEDLYDSQMRPWKFSASAHIALTPFSMSNSLIIRENTGNFSDLGRFRTNPGLKARVFARLFREIP